MAKRLLVFAESAEAQKRKYVLDFYAQHGEIATKAAFGVDRKLVYVWKKRLNQQPGSLAPLKPYSTKPKHVRAMQTHPLLIGEIKRLREKYPRLGKEKIKPLLDTYCEGQGIATLSVSTIGKVIKRRNFFFQKSGRVFHNPFHNPTDAYLKRSRLGKKRLRIKHAPRHTDFGHIQSDVVEIVETGIKRYYFNAIDQAMKFAFSYPYERLTSENNVDFYDKFKAVYPGTVKDWQTDNGSENLGEFDKRLTHDRILHYFTYPRCPKINGVIERFNRTIQEEFIQCCDILPDDPCYKQALGEYLVFYNTERVHKSLGLKSPMDYLLSKGGMSKMSMTRTQNPIVNKLVQPLGPPL